MKEQTLKEWQSEMKSRFPSGSDSVAFLCPACGGVSTIGEFKAIGVRQDLAAQTCIGRHVGGKGCNWCAYGLLATLGKGRRITLDNGDKIEVFDFAEQPAVATANDGTMEA